MKNKIYICNVLVANVSVKRMKRPIITVTKRKLTHEVFVNDTVVYRGNSAKDCQKYTHNFPWQLEII